MGLLPNMGIFIIRKEHIQEIELKCLKGVKGGKVDNI